MKPADVLILLDGRMFMFLGDSAGELKTVLFVDKEDTANVLFSDFKFAMNLGQENSVLATFHAARAIHLRLNRLAKV